MSKVILHIGTHKTATTTIQNSFAANRKLLSIHGVDYPELSRVAGHHGLVTPWHDLPKVFALPGGAERAWKQLGALARPGRVLFLSSEEFSRGLPLPRVDFRRIRVFLAPFEEIRVVCTLRDQLSYVQSIYLELAKKAAPPPWAEFLSRALATDFAAGLFLDFKALDDHLRQSFGREEILYLDYTSARAAPGGMLGAMLDLAGAGIGPDRLRANNGGRANVSPDPLAAWAANQIAMPGLAPPALVALAAEALAEEGTNLRTTLYSPAEEARVLAHFAPLNARFSERIAATAPEFAITAPPLTGRRLCREDLGPRFWLRIARRLHAGAIGPTALPQAAFSV